MKRRPAEQQEAKRRKADSHQQQMDRKIIRYNTICLCVCVLLPMTSAVWGYVGAKSKKKWSQHGAETTTQRISAGISFSPLDQTSAAIVPP
jgi:uncharacterized membrane protein